MSDITPARMELIKTSLAALYPARVVTRDLVDPANMKDADLAAGVFTIVSLGAQDFTNIPGYEAQDGHQGIRIWGDIKLGEDIPGSQIEDKELELFAEIVNFVRNKPAELCQFALIDFAQSGQLYRPYAWIACDLRYIP